MEGIKGMLSFLAPSSIIAGLITIGFLTLGFPSAAHLFFGVWPLVWAFFLVIQAIYNTFRGR